MNRKSKIGALFLSAVTTLACQDQGDDSRAPVAPSGGGGTAGTAGGALASAGAGGQSAGGTAAAIAGSAGTAGTVSDAGGASSSGECGSSTEGVLVSADVTAHTTWKCPVYTLTAPVFVRAEAAVRTKLTIAAGTIIRGTRGDLAAGRLPGALIVTRTGILEALGTEAKPIVFTSAQSPGARAPGDWGGVALLGRAPTNVPANLESAGNLSGEMFIEGLPRSEWIVYGAARSPAALSAETGSLPSDDAGEGGQGGTGYELGGTSGTSGTSGTGGTGGTGGSTAEEGGKVPATSGDEEWSCGALQYVRIEFPGFEVASGKELNGLTLAGCGRSTLIDHVQVHASSDDGIELFGGNVDLKHVVITGSKDDALDWDQGWQGRVQFLAIQMHDDSQLPSEGKGDNGIEADGFADLSQRFARPSRARISNMTLLGSATSQRAVRLREGTEAHIRNALILTAPGGAAQGLVEVSDVATADALSAGALSIRGTIFAGPWPASGQEDSDGKLYVEADYFTTGLGSRANHQIELAAQLLPSGFDPLKPGWVPAANSLAAENAVDPSDGPSEFFEVEATYRGAFAPGGADWTAPWTAYPKN